MSDNYVTADVEIRKNETGEVRLHKDKYWIDDDDGASIFQWEENNYSCDCNRELFFERAAGNDINDEECSDGRFSVRISRNGKVVYQDGEWP